MRRLALALVLLVGVAGCASDVGVAAQVGEKTIKIAEVQASVNSIIALRNKLKSAADPNISDLSRGQLRFHMLSALIDDVAAQLKIVATPAEIDARKKAIRDQLGGQEAVDKAMSDAGIAAEDFSRYLTDVIIEDEVGALLAANAAAGAEGDAARGAAIQNAIRTVAKSLTVKVNPRYGTWDAEKVDVVQLDTTGGSVSPLG
jgi:hypothetical protein